jgi:hypothetical protein
MGFPWFQWCIGVRAATRNDAVLGALIVGEPVGSELSRSRPPRESSTAARTPSPRQVGLFGAGLGVAVVVSFTALCVYWLY